MTDLAQAAPPILFAFVGGLTFAVLADEWARLRRLVAGGMLEQLHAHGW